MAPRLLDGPMGTELDRHGVALDGRAWSAAALWSAPGEIIRIHRAYSVAGATIHRANTFRTQPHILGPSWKRWMARAVQLARIAVPSDHLVWGSLAPVDDCYTPRGLPPSWTVHQQTAAALAENQVDAILCETFADPDEAVFATRAALATGLPTWTALTAGPDGSLMSPNTLAATASRCASHGAAGVLLNCTAATRCLPFVAALAETGVPWGIAPNAGSAEEGLGWGHFSDLDRWDGLVRPWLASGPSILGACCGMEPRHIHRLRSALAGDP